MFIDPKSGKATLKQSERKQLVDAAMLLRQINKFALVEAAASAANCIDAALDQMEPKSESEPVTTPAPAKK